MRDRTRPKETGPFDLDALRFDFGLVFGETHPGHFGVGVGHAGDNADIEGRGPEFLGQLFVTLHQFNGNDFSGRMQWWRCSTSAMVLNQARAHRRRFRSWQSSSKD